MKLTSKKNYLVLGVGLLAFTLGGCTGNSDSANGDSATSSCATKLDQSSSGIVWPAAPLTPRIAYVGSLSSNVNCAAANNEPAARLVYPKTAIADNSGRVLVADRYGVKTIDTNSGSMKLFAAGVDAPQQPMGIAIANDGRVFIADKGRKKIMVYDSEGVLLKQIGGLELLGPNGVGIDQKIGRIYVADASNAVYGYSLDGTLQITMKADLATPLQVAVNSQGNVYVVNQGVKRVQVFNSEGTQLFGWGTFEATSGNFIRPKGIAIDSQDNVYVTDAAFDNFQIFSENGQLLLWVGKAGAEPGQFNLPGQIYIDQQDRIYVADLASHRVQVFQYLNQN